jgi:hypothetical protein
MNDFAIAKSEEKVYDNVVDDYIDKLKGETEQKVWSDHLYDKYFQ